MKYFTIFLLLLSIEISAQSNLNTALKSRIHERTLPDEFTVLVKANIPLLKSNTSNFNYKFNYNAGDVASVTLNLAALSKLLENKIVQYVEFVDGHKQVLADTMVVRNRIAGVKSGAAPLPMAYNGTNVVVGIIDTGTDWRHADFKDALGNTRIKYIWEQAVVGGTATPQPYNYGKEWTSAQINASVCTHDDVAGNSHGTLSSGIATGNGLATGKFEGCAPKADLVIVALNFNNPGPTIADAVNYIFGKATLLGKPCVINASVGDYMGSHDGTDLEAKLIKNMLGNIGGRVMVAAAGNAGYAKFHVKTQPPANDSVFTWLTNASANLYYWCYADTLQMKNIKISVGANRANFFDLGRVGFKSWDYGFPGVQTDTLKNNGNRIGIVKTTASINADGVYELFIHIEADTLNLNWRVESKGVGLHHAWNFDFVSTGLPTVGQYPQIVKHVMPDTLLSMVSSFQCLDDVTTVGNYANLQSYYDYNNVLQSTTDIPGDIMGTSSLGPTRDGRQKPDITASGTGIFAPCAVNLQATFIGAIPNYMAPGGQHLYGSGTSASSPVVAGLGALFLQANPYCTSLQFKNAVRNCAYTDGFTGAGVPNYKWGYGKLDGKAAMQCYIATEANEVRINDNTVKFFPNPFSDQVKLEFKNEMNGELYVYTSEGKLIFSDKISGSDYELTSGNISSGYNGLLFIRVQSPEGNANFKLVKTGK